MDGSRLCLACGIGFCGQQKELGCVLLFLRPEEVLLLSCLNIAALGLQGTLRAIRIPHLKIHKRFLAKIINLAMPWPTHVASPWQLPHSACKVCTLPAKACLTGTTWSSLQVPAVSPQPHSAHLPFCAPGSSASPPRRTLSALPLAASERSRAPSRQALAPVLLPQRLTPPSQHLVLLQQLLDPGAPPEPSPQYCAGLLMATLGLAAAIASRRSLHQNSPGCTSAGRSASALQWAAGSALPCPGRAHAPPAAPAPVPALYMSSPVKGKK